MKAIVLPVMVLKEALPGLNKIVNKRSTLRVLQHVRLSRDVDGSVSIQATDLDSFATYTAKEPLPGPALEMLVPFDQLAKTTKSLGQEGAISFTREDKDKVKVRYSIGGSVVERSINTLAVDEFPPTPVVHQPATPLEPGFGIALRQAFECCSEDSTRKILNGACLDVTDKKFHYVVGTNGRCLYSANSFCFDLKKSVVIPDSKFLEWPDLLDEEPAGLSIEPGEEEEPAKNGKAAKAAKPALIKLQTGRWTYITKEIEGRFPNWKQVNPEINSKWTRVEFSDEAIKQLLLVTPSLPGDDNSNRPVRLQVEANQVLVGGQNKDDGDWTSIPIQVAKVTGKSLTVALNRIYFMNALRFGLNLMEVEDELSPVVFSTAGKKLIVMPVRLDAPRVQVSPQPEAESNQPSTQPEAQTERTAMPRTARATTPEPMTKFQPTDTTNNNGNGDGSAVKSLVEHVEQIKETLKNVIRELNTVIDTVKLAEKERKSSDKEIEAIRSKLRQIQSVAI